MFSLFGKFHPVLVHLPIGFLLLAVFFYWIGRKPAFNYLRLSVPVILVLGMLSGLFACVTGLALSQTAEYPESTLGWHQWMGIGTTLLSLGMFWAVQRQKVAHATVSSVLLLAGVTVTGHLGGTLTHGENYLSIASSEPVVALAPIEDIQQMHAYNDLVQPIFQARCVSCHGATKQKGQLRLDDPDYIKKGGEDGLVLQAGNAAESELIKRLLIPSSSKKHMPPIGEEQLTFAEIRFLQWWVNTGGDFDKQVNAITQSDADKAVLAHLEAVSRGLPDTGTVDGAADKSGATGVKQVHVLTNGVPDQPVPNANEKAIAALKNLSVVVLPVSAESNYLSVNFVTAPRELPDSLFTHLQAISDQLIWLKIDERNLSGRQLDRLAQLVHLTRLQLSYTNLNDENIASLAGLQQLQWLNLVGSGVTVNGVKKLNTLPNLKQLFLFKTGVASTDWDVLKAAFPNTEIDTGNYRLPLLPGDTSVVK